MKYKVGNIVRIREDLKVGKMYGRYEFDEGMEQYEGEQTIIVAIDEDGYILDIDDGKYYWTDEMLEPITEKEQFTKSDFKFGDIVTLRNGDELIYTGVYRMRNNEDEYYSICEYYDNLKHGISNTPFDIMKVERLRQFDGTFYKYETLYERKEEILTKEEKEWLKNVISALEVKILFIRKDSDDFQIKLGIAETFYPTIKLNLIKYKFEGMEDGKKYTLEELGL